MTRPDPRDPRGYAADAPLLEAWLRFTADVRDGRTMPFSIPGHKHRRDLVGDVVVGDVPMLAGLDTMKQDHAVLATAEKSGIVRVWHWQRDAVAEKLVAEPSSENPSQPTQVHWQAHARPARSVAFFQDRRQLISAGRDGSIVRWTWDRTAGHRIPNRNT